MATRVTLFNPQTNLIKSGYFGFSWTYLFFGWWVPLFRGELGIAALHFLFTVLTCGLWQFVMAFLYNKQFMIRQLEKGYQIRDSEDLTMRAKSAVGVL